MNDAIRDAFWRDDIGLALVMIRMIASYLWYELVHTNTLEKQVLIRNAYIIPRTIITAHRITLCPVIDLLKSSSVLLFALHTANSATPSLWTDFLET